jgi:hypothetical protein
MVFQAKVDAGVSLLSADPVMSAESGDEADNTVHRMTDQYKGSKSEQLRSDVEGI